MDPNYVENLHNLLLQSTANDTVTLKAATAALNKDYYTSPACIPALAQILASSPDQSVRQLSAVELRKRVAQKNGTLWINTSQDEREQIKDKLPELILAEQNNLVRHSMARVIAAIAALDVPLGRWHKLLPFLHSAMTSPVVAQREIGIFILHTVLEEIVDSLESHIISFFQLFSSLLNDPESLDVRITTCKAIGTIATYIDGVDKAAIQHFQSLLPSIIHVIGQCMDSGNDSGASALMDMYETLLVLETPLLGQHIPDLVHFLLSHGGNRSYSPELRVLALNGLTWTVEYKKSKIQSQGLAPAILEGLMPITTEPEPEDSDDDAPCRSALRIIDSLATALPPTQVFPPLRALIQTYLSSPDPNSRRGAMLALGVSVEGCSEYMTPIMAHVWPVIEQGLGDLDASVRKASCVALSCLCEWMEDDCASKHSVLIPVLMQLMDDPTTQRSACTALDALLEILGDNIHGYLPLIMERFASLLDVAPIPVKSVIIGAIGSAAHASGDKFLPYFQPTMDRLKNNLLLTNEGEEIELRGITMDAIGTFSEAVGKDVFRPYFPDMMKQAFSGIEMGNSRLRECSFLFFAVMARVFEGEFAPYLPSVIPALLVSLKQDEKVQDPDSSVPDAVTAFASGSSPANAITVADDGEIEIEDVDIDKLLEVNSVLCIEKEIAADTIGTLFSATGSHFLPYVEECTLELVSQLTHYYDGIRKSTLESLLEIVRTMYELSNPSEWEAGITIKSPLDQTVQGLIGHVLPHLFDLFETEDNKKVAASLCVALAETLNKVGPALIENRIEQVCTMAAQVLEQKAVCQQDPDQDETEEAPEETAEYDTMLISSAADLVTALASTLGSDFTPIFLTFRPLISKYYKKNRSVGDRSAAIGTLSEVISGMKSAITPSTEPLLDLFYQALSDEEAEVQCNAAFAAGLLVENSEIDLSPQYLHLLAALQPLFVVAPGAASDKWKAHDNAAGAVARLIVRNAPAVPLDQVLPVFIGALPLRHDFLENAPVFKAIFHLFRMNAQALHPYVDKLLGVFAHVLDPSISDQVGEDVRADLIQLIGALNAEDPAKVQASGLAPYVPGM